MRHSIAVRALVTAATLAAQATAVAPVVFSNPEGVTYKATYEDGGFVASITATSGIDGFGVVFKVDFDNLPGDSGPFGYHIHAEPVSADGNCTLTGAHHNPYNASLTCDVTNPDTCEVGDLSGKHGKASATKYTASYVDLYASLNPEDDAYFGDLSFVIHRNDSSRLACANFEKVKEETVDCSATGHTPTATTTHTTAPHASTTIFLGATTTATTSATAAHTTAAPTGIPSPIPTGMASATGVSWWTSLSLVVAMIASAL